MSAIAAAIAGAAVVAAGATVYSSDKAASAQKSAANQANLTQSQQYAQTREDQTPWRVSGGNAVNALDQFYGLPTVNADGTTNAASTPDYNQILSNLPGYQFQQQQGNQAVQRNLAASGLLQSGAAGKALQTYGQGLASNYATQYANGLQSLAGLGQTSTQATGVAGMNAANQISSNQIYAGNAQASGYVGQANAINAGLSGLSGAYGQYQQYQQQQYRNNYNNLGFTPDMPAYMSYTEPESSGTTTYYGGP